jgi:hypothetical protein
VWARKRRGEGQDWPYALRTTKLIESVLFQNKISVILNITRKSYSLINSMFFVCPAVHEHIGIQDFALI